MNEIKNLTGIYHEVQEGALCAQHALNNLLQSETFSAVCLASIAEAIDEQERNVLGHRHGQSENMDDTGFFSIQVLEKALTSFDLELIPFASQNPIAQQARADPQSIQAYICNLREHWFTIRRFGSQYFDLNSISITPKLISNTYLTLYLAQLQLSGYSIFIVNGILPECEADRKLLSQTIDPAYYLALMTRVENRNAAHRNRSQLSPRSTGFDETEIQRAIEESTELDNAEDATLQRVLAQSLRDAQGIHDPTLPNSQGNDDETLNQKLLEKAIAASLARDEQVKENDNRVQETPSSPATTSEPTIEELRQRRLQFFANKEKTDKDETPQGSNA